MKKIWMWPLQLLTVLWKVHFFIMFLTTLVFFFPFFWLLLRFKNTWNLVFLLQRLWSYLLSTLTGIFLFRKNMHHFPEPPYIVCPNHSSYLDIVLMFQAVPHNFIFMGKQEIESWPMFNILFTKGRHILVDRKNPIKAQKAYLQAAKEVDNGESLIIFPEGTIWPFVPKLKPFKNGAFRMAIEKQIPIVPITFTKNYQRLKTGAFLKAPGSPGFAEVIIHPPVETKSLSEKDVLALRDKVFEIIQSPFTKHGN